VREFLLILHILAAAAWFGTNVVRFVVNPRVGKEEPVVVAHWLRTTVAFGTRIYTPAAVIILITGIALVAVSNGTYGYGNLFVSLGFLAVIVGAVLGMAVFGPTGRRAAELVEAGGGPELQAAERKLATFGAIDMVVLTVAIVAMVTKIGV
jgi:uncharacterized membrane protein